MVHSGLLAPGASPLSPSDEKGVNETWKGRVHLLNGVTVAAYVKLLTPRQLTNELFGAELARAVGMWVPDAYVVRIDRSDYSEMFTKLNIPSQQIFAFGSRDVGVKSLARHYRVAGVAFKNWLVNHCSQWKRAVSFDGWIANIDRHLGNALIGGPDELWLIDHGHSFTGPDWTESTLIPSGIFTNRLINELNEVITRELGDDIVAEAANSQFMFQLANVEGVLNQSHASMFLTSSERGALVQFIEQRKSMFLASVAAAIGRPQLPLEGAKV